MDNLNCTKINAHFKNICSLSMGEAHLWYIASPNSPSYVGKQVTALFHTQPLLTLLVCVTNLSLAWLSDWLWTKTWLDWSETIASFPTPRIYFAAMEKNREKAWEHCHVMDRKWWTWLLRTKSTLRTNRVHHFCPVMYIAMIRGLLLIFLHGCEIKSESDPRTRLLVVRTLPVMWTCRCVHWVVILGSWI